MPFSLILLYFAVFLQSAFGDVDVKSGAYVEEWTDVEYSGSGLNWKITRAYNSQSKFVGLFGAGWCTNIESYLKITPEGFVVVSDCGDGRRTVFYPKGTRRETAIQKTIATISGAFSPDDKIDGLQIWLSNDSLARAKQAEQLQLKTPQLRPGTKFYSDTNESISFDGKIFKRTLSPYLQQSFSSDGKIIEIKDNANNFLKFAYGNGGLSGLKDNLGRFVQIEKSATGVIERIVIDGTKSVKFDYQNKKLVKVENGLVNKSFGFTYDTNGRMVTILFPDKTSLYLSYNGAGYVTLLNEHNRCLQTFEYAIKSLDTTVKTQKKCSGKVTLNEVYSFDYSLEKNFADLKTISVVSNNKKNISQFNDDRLVSRQDGSFITNYAYDSQSRLETAKSPFLETSFKYVKDTNLIKTVTQKNIEKNRPLVSRQLQYSYDGKNQLQKVQDSKGRLVKLKWDKNGNISSIFNSNYKSEILVRYNTKGKVAAIRDSKGMEIVVSDILNKKSSASSGRRPAAFNTSERNKRTQFLDKSINMVKELNQMIQPLGRQIII